MGNFKVIKDWFGCLRPRLWLEILSCHLLSNPVLQAFEYRLLQVSISAAYFVPFCMRTGRCGLVLPGPTFSRKWFSRKSECSRSSSFFLTGGGRRCRASESAGFLQPMISTIAVSISASVYDSAGTYNHCGYSEIDGISDNATPTIAFGERT